MFSVYSFTSRTIPMINCRYNNNSWLCVQCLFCLFYWETWQIKVINGNVSIPALMEENNNKTKKFYLQGRRKTPTLELELSLSGAVSHYSVYPLHFTEFQKCIHSFHKEHFSLPNPFLLNKIYSNQSTHILDQALNWI